MRIKTYIFAGFLSVCVMTETAIQPSYAQFEDTKPIILAQSGEKKGFFGRFFNRSDDRPKAKPLFLDSQNPATSRRVQPYTSYGQQPRRRTGVGIGKNDPMAQAQIDRLNAHVRAQHDATMQRILVRQQEEDRLAMQNLQRMQAGKEPVKTRMQYDPERVWTYKPNRRSPNTDNGYQGSDNSNSSSSRTRIYNAR